MRSTWPGGAEIFRTGVASGLGGGVGSLEPILLMAGPTLMRRPLNMMTFWARTRSTSSQLAKVMNPYLCKKKSFLLKVENKTLQQVAGGEFFYLKAKITTWVKIRFSKDQHSR